MRFFTSSNTHIVDLNTMDRFNGGSMENYDELRMIVKKRQKLHTRSGLAKSE